MLNDIDSRIETLANVAGIIKSLGAEFYMSVNRRLEAIGYTLLSSDEWLLTFLISKVESHIKNQCNTDGVPDGLLKIAVDMVVGEFLFGKKNMGQLTGFDFDAVVKSIQEGDTNVTFAIGSGSTTPEARFDALIRTLMHSETDFASYRCIKW